MNIPKSRRFLDIAIDKLGDKYAAHCAAPVGFDETVAAAS